MKVFLVAFSIVLFSHQHATAVPVAMVMGCGRANAGLSEEKKVFCCEHFNLECQILSSESIRTAKLGKFNGKRRMLGGRVVRIKGLGETCREPSYKCAVGLTCKGGFCFLQKSNAHLDSLLRRGKGVENEEKRDLGIGTDVEEGDPLPANKGLILHGQSIDIGDELPSEFLSSSDQGGSASWRKERNESEFSDHSKGGRNGFEHRNIISKIPRRTPSPRRVVDVEQQANQIGMEEDEIATNIAHLLESRMGVDLDGKEKHSIRQIIAGTLDERAEREDQEEEGEEEGDDNNENKNSDKNAKVGNGCSGEFNIQRQQQINEQESSSSSDLKCKGSAYIDQRRAAKGAPQVIRQAAKVIHSSL